MKTKLIISFVAVTIFTGCSSNDKLEESEKELINKINKLKTEREKSTDSLINLCSEGKIYQYSGYTNPSELANEILEMQKKEIEYQSVLDKSIIKENKYKRKNRRR